MRKLFDIFWYEYKRHVLRKRFLFALLSVPLALALMVGVGYLAVVIQADNTPIGYVDQANWLLKPIYPDNSNRPKFERVEILPFTSEEAARQALQNGEIQAYYRIEPDYLTSSKITVVFNKQPNSQTSSQFRNFLRANLLSAYPEEVVNRVTTGTNITIQSMEGSREVEEENAFTFIIPFLVGFLFVMVILGTGSYLMQAVVEEKENRTMEIVITSVSPTQLMTGKTLGNLAVGLTQIIFWLVIGGVILTFGRENLTFLSEIKLDPVFFLVVLLVLPPTLIFYAAILATLGATVTEAREAQQYSGLFTLPLFIPYWFIILFVEHPNSPLVQFFCYFPFTAPTSVIMRAGYTDIPAWELTLNIGILFLFAIGALWLAGKAFRLGMLRYGKHVSIKELFRRA